MRYVRAAAGWHGVRAALYLAVLWAAGDGEALGQMADTSAAVAANRPGFFQRTFGGYPNPRTAVVLSLALPGAGQLYNKKWWKTPIVYGALGALVYSEVVNVQQYRALRDNYKWLVDDDPNTAPTEPPYNQLDATSLRRYRDQWRRYVELNAIGIGIAYFLTAADAFVDAHLARFDVDEALGWQLRPSIQPGPGGAPAVGLGVSVRLGR